jgi:hypothetical protein
VEYQEEKAFDNRQKPLKIIIIIIIIIVIATTTTITVNQNLQLLSGHSLAIELQKITLVSTAHVPFIK